MVRRLFLLVLACSLAACGRDPVANEAPDLPTVELAEFARVLAASDKPVVVNVWASWCLPCRNEAPIFTEAYSRYGGQVSFLGLAYNDNQPGAKEFLAEFDLPFPHYFDQFGVVLAEYGGIGVPRTYFFAAGGELLDTHNGEIDAETLTDRIEELLPES